MEYHNDITALKHNRETELSEQTIKNIKKALEDVKKGRLYSTEEVRKELVIDKRVEIVRATHIDQIERWAEFVRQNPNKWKKIHADFINSMFENQKRVYNELVKTEDGRKKIIMIYNIRNIDGFPSLKK